MGIVYTGEVNALMATLNRQIFVQEHLNAHVLKSGHHTNGVVDYPKRRRWVF